MFSERAREGRSIGAGLEYLQRAHPPVLPAQFEELVPHPDGCRGWHITGIGRDEKFGAALERAGSLPPGAFRLPTADLLAGMHGHGSPIAFTLFGDGGFVRVDLGVWSSQAFGTEMDARADVLASVLSSLYPRVNAGRTHPGDDARSASLPEQGAFVLGVPAVKPPTGADATLPFDRVLRAMSGQRYAAVVLAQPLADERVERLRDAVTAEMRWVRESVQAESLPSPLAEEYTEALKRYLKSLGAAASVGAWRTACYLLGDRASLPALTSVWRSTFAGPDADPDPVRTHGSDQVAGWAARWAMPQVSGKSTDTHLMRPFELQTVLSSDRLAAYVHLPEHEVPGFAVDSIARFDTVTNPSMGRDGADSVLVGAVVHNDRSTTSEFRIPLAALTKHALVTGVTGAGKSTTIRRLLAELADRRIPFMVLEPAKAEYRALANLPALKSHLRVYTAADSQVGALHLNPLAPTPGASVAVHLDLLKSLFAASFGLWAPLPQILERCLHELYADYGWDLGSNTNARLDPGADLAGSDHWDAAFPTLGELHTAIEAYIEGLGYHGEVTANMRAALATRIGGLTVGGKGRMLNSRRSTPAKALFDSSVVLELERMPDEEDQAFLMGLLLIRLAEHRRLQGEHPTLRHLLVVEEAHRLLSRPGSATGENGNPKTKAVEAFANLLAETRSYGQGVLIADQVPVKLAPEVIKNSNLKVTHRLVADDDRMALASSMVMDERQRRALATLAPGRAAVFAEGQDAPLLIQVPSLAPLGGVSDSDIVTLRDAQAFGKAADSCRESCRGLRSCHDAQAALTAPVLALVFRMAQTLTHEPGAAARTWPEVELTARAEVPGLAADGDALDCLTYRACERWVQARAGRYQWLFGTTSQILASLIDAVLEYRAGDAPTAALRYARLVRAACAREYDPFPRCQAICPESACLHRFAVAETLPPSSVTELGELTAAPPEDGSNDSLIAIWTRVAELASITVEFPTRGLPDSQWYGLQYAAIAATLCTAQQALLAQLNLPLADRLAMVEQLLSMAPARSEPASDVRELAGPDLASTPGGA